MLHNVKTYVNIRIGFLSLSIGNWNHIAWCYVMSFTIRPCPHVSGLVCIRKHFVTDSAFVHTCPAKTHTVTANFLKRSPEWQRLKTQRIRLRVDACNRKLWKTMTYSKSAEIAHPLGALSTHAQ